MSTQKVVRKSKPSGVGSSALFCRIRALAEECEKINEELIDHGQFVASAQMDDAVGGLRKTLSCWNEGIKW